jgi:TRIAP1/MDM35 family protein
MSETVKSVVEPQNMCSACPQLKFEYDSCFLKWYNEEFLEQTPQGKQVGCIEEFTRYRECVDQSMRSKGLDPSTISDILRSSFDGTHSEHKRT